MTMLESGPRCPGWWSSDVLSLKLILAIIRIVKVERCGAVVSSVAHGTTWLGRYRLPVWERWFCGQMGKSVSIMK